MLTILNCCRVTELSVNFLCVPMGIGGCLLISLFVLRISRCCCKIRRSTFYCNNHLLTIKEANLQSKPFKMFIDTDNGIDMVIPDFNNNFLKIYIFS